jgi:hypothetical protein
VEDGEEGEGKRCYLIIIIIILVIVWNTIKFKRRHGEFEQGCVLSESYTATGALPPIPVVACLRVRYSRHRSSPERFLFGKFVREPICS